MTSLRRASRKLTKCLRSDVDTWVLGLLRIITYPSDIVEGVGCLSTLYVHACVCVCVSGLKQSECESCKGKGAVPRRHRRGAHLPHSGHWARRWINHEVCDAWPVRRQTYGYLPSRRASPPLGRYQIILLVPVSLCLFCFVHQCWSASDLTQYLPFAGFLC